MKIKLTSEAELIQSLSDSGLGDIGRYVEQKVVGILSKYIPPALLFPNPQKPDGSIEYTDVLFWFEDTLVVIECKGRKIDIGHLRDHKRTDKILSDKFRKAKEQLLTALLHIEENRGIIAKHEKEIVFIDFSEIRQIIPIVIVFEISDYFWLPTIQHSKIQCPGIQIVDLRSLFILSIYLPTVTELLSYLRGKSELFNMYPELIPYEENLLMYFLCNNKSFDKLFNLSQKRCEQSLFVRPKKIPLNGLYDTNTENVELLLKAFAVISSVGIEQWNEIQ